MVAILAVISLSLAIVNLFPFLPLDGGHIFWALVELVRRKPVSYSAHGEIEHHRFHARDRLVRARADQRHRAPDRQGFQVR